MSTLSAASASLASFSSSSSADSSDSNYSSSSSSDVTSTSCSNSLKKRTEIVSCIDSVDSHREKEKKCDGGIVNHTPLSLVAGKLIGMDVESGLSPTQTAIIAASSSSLSISSISLFSHLSIRFPLRFPSDLIFCCFDFLLPSELHSLVRCCRHASTIHFLYNYGMHHRITFRKWRNALNVLPKIYEEYSKALTVPPQLSLSHSHSATASSQQHSITCDAPTETEMISGCFIRPFYGENIRNLRIRAFLQIDSTDLFELNYYCPHIAFIQFCHLDTPWILPGDIPNRARTLEYASLPEITFEGITPPDVTSLKIDSLSSSLHIGQNATETLFNLLPKTPSLIELSIVPNSFYKTEVKHLSMSLSDWRLNVEQTQTIALPGFPDSTSAALFSDLRFSSLSRLKSLILSTPNIRDCDIQRFPQSLTRLDITWSKDVKLFEPIFPPLLLYLRLCGFNQPLQIGFLPPKLQTLDLPDFNQRLPVPCHFPPGLRTLRTRSFNLSFEANALPENLQELHLAQYSQPLLAAALPTTLRRLEFDEFENGYLSLEPGSLPSSLTHFIPPRSFNQPLDGILPCKLQTLQLSGDFNQLLTGLPQGLTSLSIDSFQFNQTIEENQLPQSLTELNIDASRFCGHLPHVFPSSLTRLSLYLGKKFRQNLSNVILPNTLTYLYYDCVAAKLPRHWLVPQLCVLRIPSFGDEADADCLADETLMLPRRLETLCLPSNFAGPLPQFPVSLSELRFTGDRPFNSPLTFSNIGRSSICELSLPNTFNHFIAVGVLPNTLRRLQLGSEFNHPLFEMQADQRTIRSVLPSSLIMLSFDRESGYSLPLLAGVLPESLQVIYFGDCHEYDSASYLVFPANIREIKFGQWPGYTRYPEPLVPGMLPHSLRVLRLSSAFKRPLSVYGENLLPPFLFSLTLSQYSLPIDWQWIPSTLQHLHIPDQHRQNPLLHQSIQTLIQKLPKLKLTYADIR